MERILKKGTRLLTRTVKRVQAHLKAMSFRRKWMVVSLLVIGSSYYSAPFGMILLGIGLIIEWRKSPERHLAFGYLLKKSVFLIPGVTLLLSAVAGAIYFGNYINAGIAILVLGPVVFCAVGIEVLWQKEDSLHFARYTAMLVLPLSIFAFAFPWSGGLSLSGLESLRLSSSFSNPNYFSYILEIILLFIIALYYHVWKPSSRIWLLVSSILSIVCLYFTGSRTGMLAFLVGLTVFYLCMSEKTILVIVFGFLTLVLIVAAIFPEKVVVVFRDVIPRPETFLNEIKNRFMLWDFALKQIGRNPVIGTGLDTYHLLLPKDLPDYLKSTMHCHNIFINFWLETGLFGILSFIWMMARTGVTAIQELHKSTVRPYLSAGIGMIVITIVHGITDAPLVSAQTLSIFSLFLACLAVMNRKTARF